MAPVLAPHPRVLQERFRAMGTDAEILVVDGDPTALRVARRRIEALEARWSRFRSGSDTTALNRCAGTWVPVADETVLLVERAVQGARSTDGRYDPTVGGAVIAHGYDRTFAEVPTRTLSLTTHPVIDGSWPMIEVDAERGIVCLPEDTVFDPGAIGKGLAADLLVEELAPLAAGILVNLGGDLRVSGAAPDSAGWVISIDDPFDPEGELARMAIASGAVATSSRLKRRWDTADGPAHHIIDPRTGRPARTDVVAVTVLAAEAWWAEVQATSLFLSGPAGLDELDDTVEALIVLADGTRHATPLLAEVLP